MSRPRKQRRGGDRRDAERRARRRTSDVAGAAPDRRLELHDAAELVGFAVHSPAGALGQIESLCVEEESWGVTDVVVIGRRLSELRRLWLPLSAIERVDRRRRIIFIRSPPQAVNL